MRTPREAAARARPARQHGRDAHDASLGGRVQEVAVPDQHGEKDAGRVRAEEEQHAPVSAFPVPGGELVALGERGRDL